jgi:hypothetical protein
MSIDTEVTIRLALQRSAMFPAIRKRVGQVSLLRSEENVQILRSINISSLRDEEAVRKRCQENKQLGLLTELH